MVSAVKQAEKCISSAQKEHGAIGKEVRQGHKPLNAHSQWHTSSSKTTPPKGSAVSPNSATILVLFLNYFKHMSLRGYFLFKAQFLHKANHWDTGLLGLFPSQ